MTTIERIFSGNLNSDAITATSNFQNADFLYMEAPGLGTGEGYEIAGSVKVFIENFEKEIPIEFPQGIIDTNVIIPLPEVVIRTNLPCQLQLLATQPVNLVVNAVKSEDTNKDISDDLGRIQTQVTVSNVLDVVSAVTSTVTLAGGSIVPLVGGIVNTLPQGATNLPLPQTQIPQLSDQFDTFDEIVGAF